MKESKGFWHNPWTIGIGTGLIVYFTPIVIAFLRNEDSFWYWMKFPFLYLWDFSQHTFSVPGYWLLIFFFLIINLFKLWRKEYRKRKALEPTPQEAILTPKFFEFRVLEYEGVVYKWDYIKDSSGSGNYTLGHISRFCPKDDCALIFTPFGLDMQCPICKTVYRIVDEQAIKMIIDHSVRKKYPSHHPS